MSQAGAIAVHKVFINVTANETANRNEVFPERPPLHNKILLTKSAGREIKVKEQLNSSNYFGDFHFNN